MQIFIGDLAQQLLLERLETAVQVAIQRVLVGIMLEINVHFLADEDFFQRSEMPLLLQFGQTNLELQLEQRYRIVGIRFQNFRNAHETRRVPIDHGSVR